MRTIMKSTEFADSVIVTQYPEGIGTTAGLIERESIIAWQNVEGFERETVLAGMIVSHRDFHISREFVMEIDHDFPFLKMQFEIQGYSAFERNSKGSLNTLIPGGRHQLFFYPEVKGRLIYPPGHRYTLEIILSLEYLLGMFGGELDPLRHFGKGLLRNEPVSFFPDSQPITPEMKRVLMDVLHCPFTGVLRKNYLQSKIVELLVQQIDLFEKTTRLRSQHIITKKNMDQLYYVRELITNNPETSYSLDSISELSGLNKFKLKQGFKSLFNETVIGYLTKIRLEKTRLLITSSDLAIADIACSLGYKNPQHFSKAFKRQFGYLPSALR